MRDELEETEERTNECANAVAFDILNFIIEESRAIRKDMMGNVWKKDALAYRMMAIESLAQTAIDSQFEFSTDGIDSAEMEVNSRTEPAMSNEEIESFWGK